jgi:hypothetical protein
VPEPLAHLYALALRTLDEQERRAEALRSRLGPVLAATALGTSLLSGPVVGGVHPGGVADTLAAAIVLVGLAVALAALTWSARRLTDAELDPRTLLATLERDGLLDDETRFHAAMIARLGDRAALTAGAVDRLASAFTAMMFGILVMLCGLALTAIVG